MGYDMNNLPDERIVSCDSAIPALHEVAQDDRKEGVKLEVNIVSARQRREEVMDGRILLAGERLLGTESTTYESLSGTVGERIGGA